MVRQSSWLDPFVRVVIGLALLQPVGVPVAAQQDFTELRGLRRKLVQLFVFGRETNPLGVRRDDTPGALFEFVDQGGHFTPSARASNGTLINFIENAVAKNLSSTPFSSTNSGFTLAFEDGNPVLRRQPPGPIFAERAQTLGAGRVLVGSTFNAFNFKNLRGVSLDRLRLNFTHVNVDFAGCDSLARGDCTRYGIPAVENEFMQVDIDLDIQVNTLSLVVAYGLFDRVDIGVSVPIVFTSLRGRSQAQIIPFGGAVAAHFFDGSPTDPELISDPNVIDGSASGLGDIAARIKIAVAQSPSAQIGLVTEARFATGSLEDLLGSGHFGLRAFGIVSSTFGAFSPHANLGYFYRSGESQNDAVLATLGFDQAITPWATLALDIVSRFQIGSGALPIPEPVVIQEPFTRVVEATTIPDMRDDLVDGSVGFKFVTPSGITLVLNSLWPLNRGGLRANVVFTTGIEYSF